MELAIVIPYYKIDYFEECLDSLANQTNKNFRVYIGDDASLEDPSDLLEKYTNKLNFTYHRFQNNLGGKSLTLQWHRCINLSAGEKWLMILGDDDYLSSNYIEEFYKNLSSIQKFDIKVVRFASRIVRSPSGEISKLYEHPKMEKATDFVYRRYFEASRGSLTEQIFRRDMYLKYGFGNIPLGWGADIYAWLQFSESGFNYTINTAIAYFRISDVNISRGGFQEEEKAKSRFLFFSKYLITHLDDFNNQQQVKFVLLYEQIIYTNRNVNLKNSSLIIKSLFSNTGLTPVLKFFRRLLIHLYSNRDHYATKKILFALFKKVKFQLYYLRRGFVRKLQDWQKKEFERRIWKRQLYFFDTPHKQELSNFRLFQSDDFQVWKNTTYWQRRLENKLNSKEFVQKLGIKTARKIWAGRREDFEILDLVQLPVNYIVKPVRGEASKNVLLIRNGYNIFDKKFYDKNMLRKKIVEFYKNGIEELIIEEFLPNEDGGVVVPNDYRFYTFDGNIIFIQLDKRKGLEKDQVSFYDQNWNLIEEKILIDAVIDREDPAPHCFEEMKAQVRLLSRYYKNFARIDFYATQKGAVFGEFTPTPRKGKFLTSYGNRKLVEAWDYYCKGMY